MCVEGGSSSCDLQNTSGISDEGLDLSQRFSESLFSGPHLDTQSEDIITSLFSSPHCSSHCYFMVIYLTMLESFAEMLIKKKIIICRSVK